MCNDKLNQSEETPIPSICVRVFPSYFVSKQRNQLKRTWNAISNT